MHPSAIMVTVRLRPKAFWLLVTQFRSANCHQGAYGPDRSSRSAEQRGNWKQLVSMCFRTAALSSTLTKGIIFGIFRLYKSHHNFFSFHAHVAAEQDVGASVGRADRRASGLPSIAICRGWMASWRRIASQGTGDEDNQTIPVNLLYHAKIERKEFQGKRISSFILTFEFAYQ